MKIKLTILTFLSSVLLSFGTYLQPTVGYIVDSQGNPMVGTNVLISAWPPTNMITGVATNLVANVLIPDTTGAGGLISNNLAIGNYRLQIPGFAHGITFGVFSNSLPINIAQVAQIPVPQFANFTLAQFSDAGTMAYRSTNDFYLASNPAGYITAGYTNDPNFLALVQALSTNANAVVLIQALSTNANAVTLIQALSTNVNAVTLIQALSTNANARTLMMALSTNAAAVTLMQGLSTNAGAQAVMANIASTWTTNALNTFSNSPAAYIVTNFGIAWLSFKTNALPGSAYTNLPNGSICTTTNGAFLVLSNATWLLK